MFLIFETAVIQVTYRIKEIYIFQSTHILIWDIKSYACVQAHTISIRYLRHKVKAIHGNVILLALLLWDFLAIHKTTAVLQSHPR